MGIDTYICIEEYDFKTETWTCINKDQESFWGFKGPNIDELVDFDKVEPIDWSYPYPEKFRKLLDLCEYNQGVINLGKFRITFCDV